MSVSIIKTSFNRFKGNISSYVSVGVLCGLFLVLVSALAFINEIFFIIGIPLLALPFVFASHISCYLLEVNEPITLKAFFRYFISFFRPQFRGSFRGLISFLKTLGVYFSLLLISYIIMYFVFVNKYGDLFTDAANGFIAKYLGGLDYDGFMDALKANDGILLTFITIVSALPLPFAIAAFLYLTSFSSIALYFRANITSGAPSLIRLGIADTYRFHRSKMRKDWLKLNWPLFTLPIIGGVVAGLICVLAIKNYALLSPMLTLGALISLIFFLPFYFPNMEVLYHRYENSFKEGNQRAIETILTRIQNSIELSEEEKRRIEESFRNNDEEKNE